MRNLWLYIAADTLLNIGFRVFQVFCTWLFIQRFRQEDLLSDLLIAIWVVTCVVLPFAGVLAERIAKAKLLIGACIFSATIISAIFFSEISWSIQSNYKIATVLLILVSLFLSVFQTIISPLGAVLIPQLMTTEAEIQLGFRIKSSMFFANLIFGPTLGGIAIGIYGGLAAMGLAVGAYCGSAIAAAILLFCIQESKPASKIEPRRQLLRLSADLVRGFRIIKWIPAERMIALASLLINFLMTPFVSVLLPAKVIGDGRTIIDVAMIEMMAGCGILFATVYGIKKLETRFSKYKISATSLLLLVISICSFAFSENILMMYVLAFVMGSSVSVWNVLINSKRAVSIPTGYRGLMESSLMLICIVSIPFGLIFTKFLLHWLEPNQVILCLACLAVPGVALVFFSKPLENMLGYKQDAEPYYSRLYSALFIQEKL